MKYTYEVCILKGEKVIATIQQPTKKEAMKALARNMLPGSAMGRSYTLHKDKVV